MNRRTFTDLQIVIHSYVILRVICGKHSFFICKISNINNSMYNWFTLKHFNMKLSVSSLKKYFARNKIVFLHLWFLTKYNLITIMNWWHWWGIYSQYFKEFFFLFSKTNISQTEKHCQFLLQYMHKNLVNFVIQAIEQTHSLMQFTTHVFDYTIKSEIDTTLFIISNCSKTSVDLRKLVGVQTRYLWANAH